jgi:hypothetical protein
MGERSFWRGDKPGNAMRGLIYVYANTDGLNDGDVDLMTATTTEYDMRLAMVIGHGRLVRDLRGRLARRRVVPRLDSRGLRGHPGRRGGLPHPAGRD